MLIVFIIVFLDVGLGLSQICLFVMVVNVCGLKIILVIVFGNDGLLIWFKIMVVMVIWLLYGLFCVLLCIVFVMSWILFCEKLFGIFIVVGFCVFFFVV